MKNLESLEEQLEIIEDAEFNIKDIIKKLNYYTDDFYWAIEDLEESLKELDSLASNIRNERDEISQRERSEELKGMNYEFEKERL